MLAEYRLAYEAEVAVNWCPGLGTVLANEEVIDGKSEVGGFPVERRPMRQWMLRITSYSERLISGLEKLEWSDSLKEMQRNWIGKSEGAEVRFQISDLKSEIISELTGMRPDTLFKPRTYMVMQGPNMRWCRRSPRSSSAARWKPTKSGPPVDRIASGRKTRGRRASLRGRMRSIL